MGPKFSVVNAAQLHLLGSCDLFCARVSSRSAWPDPIWLLDNLTPGQRDCTFRWGFILVDESNFTDPQWAQMLDWCKRFAWSLFVDRQDGSNYKAGSAGWIAHAIGHLVRFMVSRGLSTPGELSAELCKDYIEYSVQESLAFDNDGEPIVRSSVLWRAFRIIELLHVQSDLLDQAGIGGLKVHPLGGRTALRVAKQYASYSKADRPPLPDEVLIPIVNSAWRQLGTPAEDVIRLQSVGIDAYDNLKLRKVTGGHIPARERAARLAISRFQFSTIEGEAGPWRRPVTAEALPTVFPNKGALPPRQVVRQLVCEVRDAACIVLRFTAGIRSNEICSLEGGTNDKTGLPNCIKVETSKTGLNDLFILVGLTTKGRPEPQPAEWVLGSRPKGSNAILPAVHALCVLNRLYQPWRTLAKSSALILEFSSPRGLPHSSESLSDITSISLLSGQRNFILRYVDLTLLPDRSLEGEDLALYRESKGLCIVSSQWRKSWAKFVFRTNPKLVPAIAQQFKHLNIAVTEQCYIGNNPANIDALNSVLLREKVKFLHHAALGDSPIVGRMAKNISKNRAELERLLVRGDNSASEARIERWVMEQDFRIWFNDHGACLIGLQPKAARCHKLAGTTHWSVTTPNYNVMEPDVCAGCECFAIDKEHVGFWENRYQSNMSAYLNACNEGRGREFLVAKARAEQARAILRSFGVNVELVA